MRLSKPLLKTNLSFFKAYGNLPVSSITSHRIASHSITRLILNSKCTKRNCYSRKFSHLCHSSQNTSWCFGTKHQEAETRKPDTARNRRHYRLLHSRRQFLDTSTEEAEAGGPQWRDSSIRCIWELGGLCSMEHHWYACFDIWVTCLLIWYRLCILFTGSRAS
jgi:hypothetical protein